MVPATAAAAVSLHCCQQLHHLPCRRVGILAADYTLQNCSVANTHQGSNQTHIQQQQQQAVTTSSNNKQ
jgi:hypothetical protein